MRVDTDTLGERIAEHVAHIDAAMHLLLTDLRAFDQAGGWYRQGFQTCAHWLSWRVGWTLGTAREHVRVANRLAELPQIDEALRHGEMSYSKVRAMTRVATTANEHTLLEEARHTTGHQLETICRKYAMVQRHDKESNPQDDADRRYVKRRDQSDGMVQIVAALHPEEAAMVWAALERIVKEGYSRRADAPGRSDASDASDSSGSDVPAGTRSDESGTSKGIDTSDLRCDASTHLDVGRSSDDPEDGAHPSHDDVPAGTSDSAHGRSGQRRSEDLVRKQRFGRADALVVMAQEVIRGTRPNRSPVELVITVAAADLRACTTSKTASPSPSGLVSASTAGTNDLVVASTAAANDIVSNTSVETVGSIVSADTNPATAGDSASVPSRIPGEVVTMARAGTNAAPQRPAPMHAACCADGTAVSLAVVRRLGCDAGLVAMIENADGAVLSVGRKTRAIPGAVKRALVKRDGGCRFPGCTNRIFIEGHHLTHWVDGGETGLANLLSLCSHHHRFVHEYGYTVTLQGTEARFVDADGNAVRAVPEPARPARLGWETIRARNAELAIDADTPACGWDGGRIDLVSCIDELVRADARGQR